MKICTERKTFFSSADEIWVQLIVRIFYISKGQIINFMKKKSFENIQFNSIRLSTFYRFKFTFIVLTMLGWYTKEKMNISLLMSHTILGIFFSLHFPNKPLLCSLDWKEGHTKNNSLLVVESKVKKTKYRKILFHIHNQIHSTRWVSQSRI